MPFSNHVDFANLRAVLGQVGGGAPQQQQQQPQPQQPVELQVANLDQTIDQREMKRIIVNIFRQHVSVLHVSVFFQSDGNMAACVRVGNLQEAQFAISKLHRTKVGFKRILISYSHNHSQNPVILRSKVTTLLAEVPCGKLQLFKFREMFEKRYHASIGVSDLYKMREVVTITEGASGRMVQLNPSQPTFLQQQQQPMSAAAAYGQPSPGLSAPHYWQGFGPSSSAQVAPPKMNAAASHVDMLDTPYCQKHAPKTGDDQGWAERENGSALPLVSVSLQTFGPNIKQVVKNHGGSVPLSTIVHCYEADFDALTVDKEEGVPLEHLISCVKGLQIQQGVTGSKSVLAMMGPDEETLNSSNSGSTVSLPSLLNYPPHVSPPISATHQSCVPMGMMPPGFSIQGGMNGGGGAPLTPLAGQMALFSRELVDLLKSQPGCRMPFHKFIPSYHHHFGRQCRVADYGYTKLKELFEALPHIIQIMGDGSRAIITLSHRAQLKRFTSDLLRVLKSQSSKQVTLLDFPTVFEKLMNRTFKISDYGVCDVEDLLQEISETSVVLSGSGDDLTVSIPKREQTLDEVERTHQFASECIELLRHAPDCRLPFNKFIPSYHHHFGRQCRVADYGFTKLIELFEAVPGTVEVTEDADGERLLQLTDSERITVVGEHISNLVRGSKLQVLRVEELGELYRKQYGYLLRPDDFGETGLMGLLKLFSNIIRVEGCEKESTIRLIDRSYIKALSTQVRDLLVEKRDGMMEVEEFEEQFKEKYSGKIDIEQLKKDLPELVEILDEKAAAKLASKEKADKIKKSAKIDAECSTTPAETNNINNNNNNNNGDNEACCTNGNNCEVVEEEAKAKKIIRLVPLQLCASRIEKLIEDFQGKLFCCELEAAFADKYQTQLCPGQFGFHSINTLIQTGLAKFFTVRGRGARKLICPVKDCLPNPAANAAAAYGMAGGFSQGGMGRNDSASNFESESGDAWGFYGQSSSSSNLLCLPKFPAIHPGSSSSSNFSQQQTIKFSTLRHDGLRVPSLYQRQQQQQAWGFSRHQQQQQHSANAYGAFGGSAREQQHVPNYPPPAGRQTPDNYQHYLSDLAQFGIFPPATMTPGSGLGLGLRAPTRHVPSAAGSTGIGGSRLSVSPALGSPISAPGGFDLSPLSPRMMHATSPRSPGPLSLGSLANGWPIGPTGGGSNGNSGHNIGGSSFPYLGQQQQGPSSPAAYLYSQQRHHFHQLN